MNAFAATIPMLIVVLSAIAAMLAEAIRQPGERMYIAGFGLIGLTGALVASCFLWDTDAVSFGVVRADNFALFINIILCIIGILTMLFSHDVVEREDLPAGEYYALTLFAISGMMLMAAAIDLLVIFLALEVLSLAVYVLTALRRSSLQSAEAAFKYFLLGAFSSAFFLYGIAFAFTIAGSTRLDVIATAMASGPSQVLALLAVGLLAVGFCFKVSAVPFHMWTPDAYEGAPTIVTAFMSTGVKAAAFGAFVRVFLSTLEPMQGHWIPVLSAVAAITMIAGAVLGVLQSNIKRMLAYSSIAHAGYLLLGLISANSSGKAAVLFYLLAYAVANLGALGIVALLGTADHPHDQLRDFAGLWKSAPRPGRPHDGVPAVARRLPADRGLHRQVVHLLPPPCRTAITGSPVIGVLTSVISVFFYLRIVVMMYMTEDAGAPARPPISAAAMVGLGSAVLATFYLGVLPTRVLDYAIQSIQTIF